ncbi:MAG: hypothetical protein IPP83_06030 [Flavobacteriales bacterium]|nr:hypothetical protein [Flavobacteriales bacterium]
MTLLRSFLATAIVALLLVSCSTPEQGTLCERTFEPYMDLVSDQVRTLHNDGYVDAMKLYKAGDHAGAEKGLLVYLDRKDAAKGAWLYLACSQLAIGKPFEAERAIDRLEGSMKRDSRTNASGTRWCAGCAATNPRAH